MTAQQKLDELLRYVADRSTYKGDRVWLDDSIDELVAKFEFSDRGDIVFFLYGLEERGLVSTQITGGGTGATVTMDGYFLLEEIDSRVAEVEESSVIVEELPVPDGCYCENPQLELVNRQIGFERSDSRMVVRCVECDETQSYYVEESKSEVSQGEEIYAPTKLRYQPVINEETGEREVLLTLTDDSGKSIDVLLTSNGVCEPRLVAHAILQASIMEKPFTTENVTKSTQMVLYILDLFYNQRRPVTVVDVNDLEEK